MPAEPALPPVAILCGGRGTRLQRGTLSIPKPLVEIGGRPIVWHVVEIYAAHGFRDFVLLTGYRGELIEQFVKAAPWPGDVTVRCVDTGVDTPTGGRIHLARDELGAGTACVTYADGVADIDLRALLAYHRDHGAPATMTVVRPELQFGVTHLDGDGQVTGFEEKPRSEQWINGGFFCLEPGALGYLEDDSVLEREPLRRLAAAGELNAFRHEGFWDC
ncbi:MAG TPA: sugar phosphate nucleotidyltransferase, partial [Thermoleophilaceae bacterium]|nr:sugar phosphate nucleotidyltransferase [Thermoleophilaceae bacterium]